MKHDYQERIAVIMKPHVMQEINKRNFLPVPETIAEFNEIIEDIAALKKMSKELQRVMDR